MATFFGVLVFLLIPPIGKAANRLAIFSTKINFSKNAGFGYCFKNFVSDEQTETPIQKEENLNLETSEQKEDSINGPIIRRRYEALKSKKFVNLEGTAFVRNMTNLPNNVILKANSRKPAFNLEKTNEPQVLIYHTHTTECYEDSEKDQYDRNIPTRSKDTNLNVVGVGEEIVRQLEMRGIKTIHDTKIYDDPAYSGAYDRTNLMINNVLKKHKHIKVILDIHRDSIVTPKKERVAPVTMINGQKVAQLMIISGCDNGSNHYKNYEKNLSFACALEKQIEQDFPTLTRPVSFKYKHYNQSLSPGALLVEIGSQANSTQEARLCGLYFGTSLSNLLLKLQVSGSGKKQEPPKDVTKSDKTKNVNKKENKSEKKKENKNEKKKDNKEKKEIKKDKRKEKAKKIV